MVSRVITSYSIHYTKLYDGPWERVRPLVDGHPGARYKGYLSEAEAQAAYAAGNSNRATAKPATSRRPAAKRTTTSKPPLVTTNGAHADSPTMQIYADGACNPNPGPAGTGLAVYEHGQLCELWYGLSHKGTNNTAELQGLEHALLHAKQALAQGRHQCIQILTDSKYSLVIISYSIHYTKLYERFKLRIGFIQTDGNDLATLYPKLVDFYCTDSYNFV